MVLPLVVGGVMAAGALAKGIGSIKAGNKSANAAMDAAGAQVGATDVAAGARTRAYDAARALDKQTLQQILNISQEQFGEILGEQKGALAEARGRLNPLVAMGDQYQNALAYNDGFGERPEGYAEFTGTPGYQFRVGEATNALNNRLAAMGSLNSGAAVREAMRVRDGMASQEHQLHYNRLAAGADRGDRARYSLINERNRFAQNSGALRSNYAADRNNALRGSLVNQMNLVNLTGEAEARRATDAANAYASGRMGAVKGQTQAMQAGYALPGQVASAFMSGASMGMGGMGAGGSLGSLMGGGGGGMFGGMFGGSSFGPGMSSLAPGDPGYRGGANTVGWS